ncbi:hypothetical protein [Undibacterium pigrum]|uniref:Uncharacterized protein n=1 Tax=Undibacterium pigrum TaxID=401470 RepID=A0A318IX83_9BURK|nr:hypothetical protein [Undibacterium pigrum]PXX38567.1 hypothetical protein DFR42_11279 [Undibacterium pigrum]
MEDLDSILLFNSTYERAQDLLGGLIALRSAWIGDEYHIELPDEAKLHRLQEELFFFMGLRKRLLSMSTEEIAELIEQYRPQFKEEDDVRRRHEAAKGLG